MRDPRKTLLPILLAFSMSAPAAPSGAEVTLYYYDRLPFFGDVNGKPGGLLIDIAKLVFDEAGVGYVPVNVPVVRFFAALKKPGNACLLGALRTSEREAIYSYSDDYIYRDQPFRLVIHSDKRRLLSAKPTIAEILSSGLRLGVSEGYVYGNWLDSRIAEYQPTLARVNIGNATEKMHAMISAGRIDYVFAVAEEARHIMDENRKHARQLTVVEIADAPRGNARYLLCSKGIDADIMRRINVAIGKVKASPQYEKIVGPHD